MLKRRVVIMLCLCDGVLHRTKRFVPDYRYTTALIGNRNADEIVIVDVTPVERRMENRRFFYDAVQRYVQLCYSPVTIGGGVRTLDEVLFLFRECGADKVVIGGTRLIEQASLGSEIAHRLGRQALVAAVNVREDDICAHTKARLLVNLCHAGEILLNSIDRDGSLLGYDMAALAAVAGAVDVPVMVAGGCGTWRHMGEAFEAGASAACTSVIHHLTETSLAACKAWLVANCKQPVRAAA